MKIESSLYSLFTLLLLFLSISSCSKNIPPTAPSNSIDPFEFIEPSPTQEEALLTVKRLITEYEPLISEEVKLIIQNGIDDTHSAYNFSKINSDAVKAEKLLSMGIEAILRGSIKTALYCFLLSIQYDSSSPHSFTKAAFCLNYLEQYDDSKKLLLRSKEINSSYHATYACLSKLYRNTGDYNRSIYNINKALQYFPINPFYMIEKVYLCLETDQDTLAAKILHSAKNIAPYLREIQYLNLLVPQIPEDSDDLINYPTGEMNYDGEGYILPLLYDLQWEINNKYAEEIGNIFGVYGEWESIIQEIFLEKCYADAETPEEECANCLAAKEEAIPKLKDVAQKGEKLMMQELNELSERAFTIYYQNPNAVDREPAYWFIMSDLATREQFISGIPRTLKMDIADITQITALSCNQPVPSDSILYPQNNFSLSLCFYICINVTESSLSIDGNLVFIHGKLEYDMKNKAFGLGVGLTAMGYATIGLGFNTQGQLTVYETFKIPVLSPGGIEIGASQVLIDFN